MATAQNVVTQFFSRWALVLALGAQGFCSGLLLLASWAAYISPESWPLLALLGLGYVWYWLACVGWAAWWLYRRSRFVYISLIPMVLTIQHWGTHFQFRVFGGSPPKTALRLLTYNVHYFNYLQQQQRLDLPQNLDSVLGTVLRQGADIVCLQEFSGVRRQYTQNADAAMRRVYPHSCQGGGSSLAIYSRYTIEKQEIIKFVHSHNSVLWADVRLPSGALVRVYNMHLQSNRLGADAEHFLDKKDFANPKDKATAEKYKRISSKLLKGFVLRADQAAQLAEHIQACPHPVLLCGDLNDTPISYSYRQLVGAGLSDSFVAAGSGFGSTYAGVLPFLRIDYVLAGAGWRIHSHQILPDAASDHRAVLVSVGRE